MIDGHCGVRSLTDRGDVFETLPSQIAGTIPLGSKVDGAWDVKDWIAASVGILDQHL